MAASAAVSDVQDDELRSLTDAEALRRTEALLSLSPLAPAGADAPWQDEQRRTSSGFIEQQAHFARLERR